MWALAARGRCGRDVRWDLSVSAWRGTFIRGCIVRVLLQQPVALAV